MSFSDFKLKKEFIASIEAAGYQSPTPLQSELIPIVADRKSVLVWTQSASGKTGAFLIPAMNYILENPDPDKRGARILILTSRRDRVSQINYTIKRLSNNHVMRFGFIVSGRPYQTQMRLMRRPLDIMIATPGRLNDLMNNGKADFSGLEMLIIDDLTSIYQKNLHGLVEKIIEQAGDKCSSITFVREDDEVTPYAKSLFPEALQISIDNDENTLKDQALEGVNLADENQISNNVNSKNQKTVKHLHKPANRQKVEVKIPQKIHIADDYTHKIAMMDHLLDEFAGETTIIYVATHKAAKMLQDNLANHGHAAEMLNELDENEVETADILIVCDQGRQLIDNDRLALVNAADTHVIHFDLPRKTDTYLERISSYSDEREEAMILMIDGFNYNELKHLEKTIGNSIDQVNIPGLEPLQPFTNKSRPKKPAKQQKNHAKKQTNKRHKASKSKSGTNSNSNRNRNKANNRAGTGTNGNANSGSNNTRRQRKGPFARLNGGANRKKGKNTIGVSRRGTDAPVSDRAWQSDFAEPRERKAKEKTVTIRYSRKRTLLDKPEEI